MLPNDPLRNVLYVDLEKRKYRVEDRSDLFVRSLGGSGVAAALLAEECPEGTDAFAPENPIILAVGPLTGHYPLASKTVAMFKSPLTGNLGESHAGGRSAVSIRMAGYGAIVIKGKSDFPVYLAVHGGRVHFRDASAIWGMRSNYTAARAIREAEPMTGRRTIMRIGRAGENLCRYACVTTETYRHFGRLGLGAVFGSKKLKALMVGGARTLPMADKKLLKNTYDHVYKTAVESGDMKKYHDLGTAANVMPLSVLGGLPTRNLASGKSEHAEELSGENLAEKHLGRRLACAHCPVGCIHIAALREPYDDEPYFYKTDMIPYDYELIYALGSMLDLKTGPDLLRLIDHVEYTGLDAMSSGVALAWATEAFEKKLIGEKETLGLRLEWGNVPVYEQALEHVIGRSNKFYRLLGEGTVAASNKYGGAEFALAFGGNEMPGYHTGPAAHISHVIGSRHSHLDSGGYSLDRKVLSKENLSPEEVADRLIDEECARQVLSSLVVCFFARKIYKPDVVKNALASVGFRLSEAEIEETGRRTRAAKYAFKLREGFSLENYKWPERIFETESPLGKIDKSYLDKALAHVRQRLT